MEKSIFDIQKTVVEKLYNFCKSDEFKGKVYLPSGFGKYSIIISLLEKLLTPNYRILILESRNSLAEQLKERIKSINEDFLHQQLLITTYQTFVKEGYFSYEFDVIICINSILEDEKTYTSKSTKNCKFIAFFDTKESDNNYFSNANVVFNCLDCFPINQMKSYQFIEDYVVSLLTKCDFKNIQVEKRIEGIDFIPDVIAEYQNRKIFFEIKNYRNITISPYVLCDLIKKLQNLKVDSEFRLIVILTCIVDDSLKQEIYNKYNIEIWDLKNLVYLSKKDEYLIEMLMTHISFPIADIQPQEPLFISTINEIKFDSESYKSTIGEQLKEKIKKCPYGRENGVSREYELICTQIIKYLFGTEFLDIFEQHKTGDLFKIDLLCSLKGTTEFWNFLINFYKTKFVVFEYKNYNDKLLQNNVYVTEKYLYRAALRNVAFIVSRKGFSENARKAAAGCLKENGKLIIDLKDEDLIKMIEKKENGEEPSDYLLSMVESVLMNIDK